MAVLPNRHVDEISSSVAVNAPVIARMDSSSAMAGILECPLASEYCVPLLYVRVKL